MFAPIPRFLALPVLLAIAAMLLLVATQHAAAQSPPTITNVSPGSGPAAGGTTVTITGTGFVANATTVRFNDVDSPSVTVSSASSLTAVTPGGGQGPVTIAVTTEHGSATLSGAFVYMGPAPTVGSVNPSSGPSSGGTAITITGTGFQSGATVTLGGTAATSVVVVNSETITATTQARPAGTVAVQVTNTDGQQGSMANGFTYTPAAASTVSTISPNSGPTTGGTSVTITGSNFVTGAAVSIGGASATNVTVNGAGNQITAVTGVRSAGTVSVVVTNPDNQSGTLLNGFTYVATAPTVSAVSPSSGTTSGGTVVTITGTGFASGATVRFGGTLATNVTVNSPTQITATTPARISTGAVNVEVRNTDNQSGTRNNGFTYTLGTPVVASVSPNSGPTAGGTVVTITGNGFVTGAVVRFGGTNATNVTVNSPTQITATAPPRSSAGSVAVEVRNSSSQLHSLANAFTYVSVTPTVSSVSPNSGTTGGGTPVTITGTGFLSGATVRFGGTQATNVVVVSQTTVTARTPSRSSTGSVAVQVMNTNGQSGQLTSGFTYIATPAPAVTAISPNAGPTSGGNTVTITGTGFLAGATVQFGNRNATNVNVASSTMLTAVVPSSNSVGTVNVRVANTDGKNHTLNNAYTYTGAPTISAVSPSSGTTAGGTDVTITGTNFVTGITVTFGGSSATNVTVNSATQLTARTPARSAGTVTVSVQSPGGQQASLSNAFTYRTPAIVSSISPSSGPTAGGTTITITGSGFESAATVTVGGAAASSVNVVSSTQITARTPSRSAGAATVEVRSAQGILATGTPTFTYIQTTGTIVSGSIPSSGVGLFVFSGGSNEELVAVAVASGCPALRVAFFATIQGRFITFIPGAPAFVNAAWNAQYANGIPANTPLLASCR